MPQRLIRPAVLIAAVLMAGLLPPPSAYAAPPAPVIVDIATGAVIPAASPDAATFDDPVVDCIAQFNPVPQYSTSGGTFGTVHWGGKVSCVGTPGTLVSVVRLYSVQGTGENEHTVPEDKHTLGPVVGLTVGGTWFTACLGRLSTRWIASTSSTYNGNLFTPPTGWSAVFTLPCTAG